jgi:hypothetical protein
MFEWGTCLDKVCIAEILKNDVTSACLNLDESLMLME